MSADNWAVCPRCQKAHDYAVLGAQTDLAASYGTLPLADFDAKRAEVEALAAETLKPTFREDYEIYGAEDGEVEVTYRGKCQTCGLSLTFKHSHPLDVDGAA